MRWRDEIFGFTFEPAVIVYNKDLVPPEDVRRTHTELIDLLRAKPERYQGKMEPTTSPFRASAICSPPSTPKGRPHMDGSSRRSVASASSLAAAPAIC